MDGSPIHLACDRWTILWMKHFSSTVHEYFDGLYKDAISIAKSKKIRDYEFVDILFQKWCRNIEKDWTIRERDNQIKALREKYGSLESLIVNVINANLLVMSTIRQADIHEIPEPEVNVEKFVHLCYWNVAREVAFPYPLFFNTNVVDSNRFIYHYKARKSIEKSLKHSLIEVAEPILEKLSVRKKKKKRHSRRKSPGRHSSEPRDINSLTEDNLKKFTEQQDLERIKKLKEFQNTRKQVEIVVDDIYPDDSASAVYRQHEIKREVYERSPVESGPTPESLKYLPSDVSKTLTKNKKDINNNNNNSESSARQAKVDQMPKSQTRSESRPTPVPTPKSQTKREPTPIPTPKSQTKYEPTPIPTSNSRSQNPTPKATPQPQIPKIEQNPVNDREKYISSITKPSLPATYIENETTKKQKTEKVEKKNTGLIIELEGESLLEEDKPVQGELILQLEESPKIQNTEPIIPESSKSFMQKYRQILTMPSDSTLPLPSIFNKNKSENRSLSESPEPITIEDDDDTVYEDTARTNAEPVNESKKELDKEPNIVKTPVQTQYKKSSLYQDSFFQTGSDLF